MNGELFRRKRMLETAQSIEGFEGFPRKGGGKGSRYETEPKLPGGYGAWLCHFAPSYTQFSKRGDFETKSREIFNAWSMPAACLSIVVLDVACTCPPVPGQGPKGNASLRLYGLYFFYMRCIWRFYMIRTDPYDDHANS